MVFAWIVAVVVFSFIEAATTALVSIWFVFGAVAAFIAALITDSLSIQLTAFVAVSVITLVLTRPIMKKKLHRDPVATNADRVIGQHGEVLQDLSPDLPGRVLVDGLTWAARCEQPLKKGEHCTVTAIHGATLEVRPL